jgi:hypothetical protein
MSVRRILALAVGVALFMSLGMVAAGAAAQTERHEFEESFTFAEYHPCLTDPDEAPLEGFEITVDLSGVDHHTHNKNGDHFTYRVSGTFVAVPVFFADADEDGQPEHEGEAGFAVAGPREGESFTGTFTDHGNGNINQNGSHTHNFNFRGQATGDEGTTFTWHDHGHITATGDPFEDPFAIIKNEFFKSRCN